MQNYWYQIVRNHTVRLVGIRSVNSTEGELHVAEEALRLLQSDGPASAYTAIGLDPLPGDAFGRQNAYAFLRGNSLRALFCLDRLCCKNLRGTLWA